MDLMKRAQFLAHEALRIAITLDRSDEGFNRPLRLDLVTETTIDGQVQKHGTSTTVYREGEDRGPTFNRRAPLVVELPIEVLELHQSEAIAAVRQALDKMWMPPTQYAVGEFGPEDEDYES